MAYWQKEHRPFSLDQEPLYGKCSLCTLSDFDQDRLNHVGQWLQFQMSNSSQPVSTWMGSSRQAPLGQNSLFQLPLSSQLYRSLWCFTFGSFSTKHLLVFPLHYINSSYGLVPLNRGEKANITAVLLAAVFQCCRRTGAVCAGLPAAAPIVQHTVLWPRSCDRNGIESLRTPEGPMKNLGINLPLLSPLML